MVEGDADPLVGRELVTADCEDLQVLLSGPAYRVTAEIVNLARKGEEQHRLSSRRGRRQEDIKLSVGGRREEGELTWQWRTASPPAPAKTRSLCWLENMGCLVR